MTIVTEQQVTERLSNLIQAALNGEEVPISRDDTPVIKLTPLNETEPTAPRQAKFGSGKGLLLYMAPDFDAPLEEMREYME